MRTPTWERPATRWSDGAPLGSGRVGAVVWGDGSPLRVTVDHTAAWDAPWAPPAPGTHTFAAFRAAITERDASRWGDEWPLFQPGHQRPEPSRLPPARVDLAWPNAAWRVGELDLETGTYAVSIEADGLAVDVRVVVGDDDVIAITGSGPAPTIDVRCFREAGAGAAAWFDGRQLPIATREVVGTATVVRQRVTSRPDVALAWRFDGDDQDQDQDWSLRVTVGVGIDDDTLRSRLEGRATTAAARQTMDSWLAVPDQSLQDLWEFERYKLGAVTRVDGDAIALQGPWSPDGMAPPWNGDYHWNVNVQMSYWPLATLGRFDLYEPLWALVDRALPSWRQFAADYLQTSGAFVPHATDIDGRALFNWAIPSFGLGNGAWLAHILWQQWTHTRAKRHSAGSLRSFASSPTRSRPCFNSATTGCCTCRSAMRPSSRPATCRPGDRTRRTT